MMPDTLFAHSHARPYRIGCIGEALIELYGFDFTVGTARVGFAGDTLNTATYLARLLPHAGYRVDYVTNLGCDAFSDRMIETWQREGIGTGLIGRHPQRSPGIYLISLDCDGERSFSYWRDQSAARTLFGGVGIGLDDLGQFDLIYLSGITLAILPASVRAALIARLAVLRRAGTLTVFDTNYRPALWTSSEEARSAFGAMTEASSVVLPSLDDERRFDPGLDAGAVLQRLHRCGTAEAVAKDGANGATLLFDGQIQGTSLARATSVVDTTGAGDAFNAGYLAARLEGKPPVQAAEAAHSLALRVLAHPGAILPARD